MQDQLEQIPVCFRNEYLDNISKVEHGQFRPIVFLISNNKTIYNPSQKENSKQS